MSNTWTVNASQNSLRTVNPIRSIVESIVPNPTHEKSFLSLSIGDPTTYGNLLPSSELLEAVTSNVPNTRSHAYLPAIGHPAARAAVADYFSLPRRPTHPLSSLLPPPEGEEGEAELTAADVIFASGCSGALEMSINVLCDAGDELLIPVPGFSLYETICGNRGILPRFYHLLPEKGWEIDLEHLRSQVSPKTKAIILINPSNPTGSVYSKEHLQQLVALADELHLPIIADEIYRQLVFSGHTFYPIASLTKTVPVLSVGGIAKTFLVPGWRLGWILIHDRHNAFSQVRVGLQKLSQLTLGPCGLIQLSLPSILRTPPSYFQNLCQTIQRNAEHFRQKLESVPSLRVIEPQGAMYLMVEIRVEYFEDVADDFDFTKKLLSEENVSVLPGKVFHKPNFIRIVTTPPFEVIDQASERIRHFCENHKKKEGRN